MDVPTQDLDSYRSISDEHNQPTNPTGNEQTMQQFIGADNPSVYCGGGWDAIPDYWKASAIGETLLERELGYTGESLAHGEHPLIHEHLVDIPSWNQFCAQSRTLVHQYRHALDSVAAQGDSQSLITVHKSLQTMEEIGRPYITEWSQAEVQNETLKQYWYGKGVRTTPPTQHEAALVETAGRVLTRWYGTLTQKA